MENVNWIRWAAIAIGAAVVIHSLGIYDVTKIPVFGKLFANFLKPFAPKPVDANRTVALTPAAADAIATPHERCARLELNLLELRHFASERETTNAMKVLEACDVIEAELTQFHNEHDQNSLASTTR